jgi:putative membrane protein
MSAHRLSARIGACSATALLAAATLLAQNPGSMPTPPQQQQPTQPTTPNSSASQGTAPTAQSFGDQAFVAKAMEGSKAQVELAQLAQQKSQSNDVKQLAQKVMSDHSQMNDKWFSPVAKQLGVAEPKGPSKKDKKEIAKLQGLSGSEFDAAYLRTTLKDNESDLKDFKEEAQAAQDPSVKQIAQQGTTVLTQQVQLTEQVAKNHNVPVEGKEISSK